MAPTKKLLQFSAIVLLAVLALWAFVRIPDAAAAPGPPQTVWLDGTSNPFMPVDVTVNAGTGLAYVVNQGVGHVWVISGTEHVETINPSGGGCPGHTPYGACLNSVNVNPFTDKAYVSQWFYDRLNIISGTELSGWVYGGQGTAGSVTHPQTDTVYALFKWGSGGVTIIKEDDDKTRVYGSDPDAGCVNPLNGYAYIANTRGNNVLVFDDVSKTDTISVGSRPNSAVCAEDGRVYVVNSGSNPATVSVITGTQVITTVSVGQSTTNLGVDGYWGTKLSGSTDIAAINEQTGYVYVANWGSDSVSVISGTTWITDVAVGDRPNSIGVYTPTNTIYVANIGSDTVSVISGTEVIETVPVGDYPIALDVNARNGYVYVTNRDSDSVSIILGTEVVETIGRPRPQALATQDGQIYSANSNGTLSVIEGANLLDTIPVGKDPHTVVGDGTYLYTANTGDATVSVISGTAMVTTVAVGSGPQALAAYTPTQRVYVANATSDTVSVIKNLAVEATIPVDGGPGALAVDPATGDVFVANGLSDTVTVINDVSQIGSVAVDGGPEALAFNPTNGYVYVANSLSDTVSILDGTSLHATQAVSATPSAVAVDPDTGYVYVTARDDDAVNVLQGETVVATIPVGDQPNAVAVDRDRGFVHVACKGDDRVWVLSGTVSLDLDFGVGDRPVDALVTPGRGDLYVANYGDFSLSRVQNAPPSVSMINPDRTEVGQSVTVTVNGSGYFLTPTVWLDDVRLEDVQRLDRTTLSGRVPATLPIKAYTVTVRTADELTGTKVSGFMVTQHSPTATAITPASFYNHVTTTVRITGSGFISTPIGNVGDIALQDPAWQNSEVITAQIPAGLPPGRYQTLFYDNMEQNVDHWSPESSWQLTNSDYHSADRAWRASNDGTLVLSRTLNLAALPSPQLSFWERRTGYWSYDHAYVELSVDDGASWDVLRDATTSTGWRQTTLDLSGYAASPTATLRFRMEGYVYSGGWYIDDVHLGSMPDGLLVTNPGPGSPTGYLTAPFTVTNRAHHYIFDAISSPQVIGDPFTVTISAYDAFDYLAQDYTGSAALSATAPISPLIVGPFSDGVWRGTVQIDAIQANVRITATDTLSEAVNGISAAFDVSAPTPIVSGVSPLTFSNDVTTTLQITVGQIVSTPAVAVGDVSLLDVTRVNSSSISGRVPPGLSPGRYQTAFFDNLEQSVDHWAPDSVWQLTSSDYHSPGRSWFAGDGASYGSLYLNLSLDLTAIPNPRLSFWERRSGYWSYDHAYVELSTDGGATWDVLRDATTSTDWRQTTLDLSAYAAAPTATLRFRISGYVYYGGWHIDDIHLGSMQNGLLVANQSPGSPTGYLTAPFTVTNQARQFVFHSIPSPQVIGEPFTVTISTVDDFGFLAPGYSGTANLSAPVSITPSVVGPFVEGVWSGPITLTAGYKDAVITATDTTTPTIAGASQAFNVLDSNLNVLEVSPQTISNHLTTTIYVTGTSIIPLPAVRIGREIITDVSMVDDDTVMVTVPPGLPPRTYGALLYDNAEGDKPALWQADPPWTHTVGTAHSPTHSWEASFTEAISASLTLSETLDLTTLTDPKLDFWHQLSLEAGDVAIVEIASGSFVWQPLKSFTAKQELWGYYQLDLRPFASHSDVRIRFRVYNESAGGDGVSWNLDDIAVTNAAGGVGLTNPGEWAITDLWKGDFTITNQAAQFDVEFSRYEQVADVPFTVTITARDAFGHVVRDYSDDVALAGPMGSVSPTVVSGFVDGRSETTVQLDTVQTGAVITATGATAQGASAPFDVVDQGRAAYLHLEEQLGLHDQFWVYSDGGAPTNHYGLSYMGVYTDVQMEAFYTATVHSGSTAIRVTYTAFETTGLRWGGGAWLDPEGNWSGASGGFYLQGATELVFWAKGERGGELVEFGMGGVPEGAPARSLAVRLTDRWQRYAIPLHGLNLDRVVEGFYWAANCDNNPGGVTFYLDDVHYRYRSETSFYVFKDQFSLDNRYVQSWMGDIDQIHVDEGVPDPAYPGATVTRFTYDSLNGADDWAGVYYLWPAENWGDDPTGGYDLSGATKLVFRARSEKEGVQIDFGMGDVTGGYGDSTEYKRTFTLSSEWQEYTVDLTGYDLSRVVGGFHWSVSRYTNSGPVTFYLDDIRYVFDEMSWPHFIPSYVADLSMPDDVHFAGSAHVYDNALAILSFLARGTASDLAHARDIADAMVYAQDHDPYFTDDRLRNVYHAEALGGSNGVAWYWNDAYGAGSHVGNMSWATLALARMYQATGASEYLDAALRLGEWIYEHTYDGRFYGGYTGGYDGWGADQTRNDWKSTEHNIDAYVAFTALYDITDDARWWEWALHAKDFVRAMWHDGALDDGTPVGWFWTGTKGDFLVYGDWEETITTTSGCQPTPTVAMPHNHYYPTRFGMGMNNIQLNTRYTATAHSDESSIRLLYSSGSLNGWAGFIALEGQRNWGTKGPGYEMIGARSLTVWMKGADGGETAVIGIGGVPYTTTTLPISTTLPGAYADALSKTVTLTADWRPYTITVPPTHTLDMQHHIGGFFAYLEPSDNPDGADILLDDIVYHFDDASGEMLDYKVLVADVNSWGLMALGERPRYGKTADWNHDAFRVTETVASQVITGYDFDIDKDGIWFEGTGQGILAAQIAGKQAWSDALLADMVIAQEQAPRANRKGLVAALDDCLTTNLGWFYYNRLHVAPTAWYLFAAREHNPYWGITTLEDIPHQGPVIQTVTQIYLSEQLVLQGSNFDAPTVTLQPPLSGTFTLDVSAFTSTTLTATLPAPLSKGVTYTVTLTNPDAQADQQTFVVECPPPVEAHFTYLPLVLRTYVFTATSATGDLPITYTWDFGGPPLSLDGIAYGPFRENQQPGGALPDEAEIREDLEILSRHTDHIRLYGSQEAAPDIVRIAAEENISVTLGAWIDAYTSTTEMEITSLISLTNYYSNVVAVTVGNERLLFNEISETQLITYVQQVQGLVDVPVSTAETWDIWLEHPQLADAVDFLMVHLHPYWAGVSTEKAVDWIGQRYQELRSAYPDKPIVIGETGWPTDGDDYGAAHPGEVEQRQFTEAFTVWAGANQVPYFYFEGFDEPWKCDSGPIVECHWGIFTARREPKPVADSKIVTDVRVISHTFPAVGDYTVTLTTSNACGYSVYSETVAVTQLADVELAPDNADVASPGTVLTYIHTLTNTGTTTDTFGLLVSPGWGTLMTSAPITLAQGLTHTVEVSVAVPTDAISGTVETTVVTATSQLDPGVFAAALDTTTVITTPVAEQAGVELTPDHSDSALPGEVVTYTHTLTNTGTTTDTFDLLVSPGWGTLMTSAPITLAQGLTHTVEVSVTVPSDAISGTVDTTVVTATSQLDLAIFATVTGTITITVDEVDHYNIYLPLALKNR